MGGRFFVFFFPNEFGLTFVKSRGVFGEGLSRCHLIKHEEVGRQTEEDIFKMNLLGK